MIVSVGYNLRPHEVIAIVAHFVDRKIHGRPGHGASELFSHVLSGGKYEIRSQMKASLILSNTALANSLYYIVLHAVFRIS